MGPVIIFSLVLSRNESEIIMDMNVTLHMFVFLKSNYAILDTTGKKKSFFASSDERHYTTADCSFFTENISVQKELCDSQ